MHHVYPFIIGLLTPLYLGETVVIQDLVNGTELVKVIHDEKVTVVIGIPRLYSVLYNIIEREINAYGGKYLLSISKFFNKKLKIHLGKFLLKTVHDRFGNQLRVLACGGAALSKDIFSELEAIGWQMAIGYGLTETSSLLTMSGPGKGKPGSAGKVANGVNICIDKSAAPVGSTKGSGEILAKGPNVFGGYRNLPHETSDSLTKDNWLRTDDLGYFDKKGFLWIIDRLSSVIVTENGENIQPEEVEAIYERHHFIQEIGIFQYEGKLMAIIVPQYYSIISEGLSVNDGVRIGTEEQSLLLPSYKRINGYAITSNNLQRTRLGKIRRHLLIHTYQKIKESEKNKSGKPVPITAMNGDDRKLLTNTNVSIIWNVFANHFPNSSLSMDSLLRFDLGIDSLELMELLFEIREKTGVEITENALQEIHSVRDILRTIAKQSTGNAYLIADLFKDPLSVLDLEKRKFFDQLPFSKRFVRRTLYLVNYIFNKKYFNLSVSGLDNVISAGQCIITPNHVSFIDSFVMAAALPYRLLLKTVWAAGVEVAFGNKLNSYISRLAGALPIEHGMNTSTDMALVVAAIDKRKNVIWYPEGRRAPGKDFLPFRHGIGLLLQKREINVVPVIIQGTEKAMPIGVAIPRPAHVSVTFGEKLSSNELLNEPSGNEFTDSRTITSGLQTVMETLHKKVRVGD